ncbi:MAG: hypothetical protein CMF69_11215 [Magnetovibrio sp.]|nr:hypothetical protein [Magnetovibrio sp.]
MTKPHNQTAWRPHDLLRDQSWVFSLSENARKQLAYSIKKVFDPDRPLFDYSREDFDLGPGLATVVAAAEQAYFGYGLTLVRGLPRKEMTEQEYRLMIWALGLNLGVPRPQGRASQYISEVRATGMNYRSAGGRGYNSNAGLDFHCDGCDLVALACYNKAKRGGQSLISSSVSAWQALLVEYPELAETARHDFYFSRNQEEAPDEAPYYAQPLFDFEDGRLFSKWNRNRVRTAQDILGVPKLSVMQKQCGDVLDLILRRPDLMYTMWLQPGDLQFINNHVILHSRTTFDDYDELNRKRLLFRLWIAPPYSVQLPNSWEKFFNSTDPGTVRGGIRGHNHDFVCKDFELRQAESMGMPAPVHNRFSA